jgi:opacity protein-like surface antigen
MNAPALMLNGGVALGPRVDALAGFEFSRSGKTSEYRHFVDNNRLPINQVTHLRQLNLSGSLRFALLPRGRAVSRLAWIPRTVIPYVGAGAGILWYKFEQDGDFVDIADLSVFNDTLTSKGWGPSAHIFGGVDVNVWRRMYLTTEGRYLWSHADVNGDFSGFQPIDLAGAKVSVGVRYAF